MTARLIVFAGPACSGKTELASRLARLFDAPHLQMDATRARLMPDSPHTRHDREIAYRAMAFAAELLLSRGQPVILDAPYGHPEDRKEVEDVAKRTAAALYVVQCHVTPEEAARRLRARPPDHPGLLDLNEERVIELARSYPFSAAGLCVDTEHSSLDDCVAQVQAYIGRGAGVKSGAWV